MNYKVFLLLLYCFSIYGQEISKTNSGLSDAELSYAVEEYAKMTKTATWLEYHDVQLKFLELMGDAMSYANSDWGDKEKLTQWVELNLSMTKFKTIEEAVIFFDEMEAQSKKMQDENKELYDLMRRTTPKQLLKIWRPLGDLARQGK